MRNRSPDSLGTPSVGQTSAGCNAARIIALDDQYQYALVGSNDRKYLWILSRSKSLDPAIYKRLVSEAAKQGFNTDKLMRTVQE